MIPLADTPIQDSSLQILEIRAAEGERRVKITAAVASGAIQAIYTALSEQLDRDAQLPTESAEDVRALREQSALVERLQPLAVADSHAVISFSEAELRMCALALTQYSRRADGEGYQPPELRDRLRVADRIAPVLQEAGRQAASMATLGGP